MAAQAPGPGGQRAARAIERRVRQFLQEEGVLLPGETALVALSGGPDSSALLLLLHRLRDDLGLRLAVAHFDHGLRPPEEAAADLAYARELACSLGLPLHHGAGDTAAYARARHLSLEEAARHLRYRFLGETARALGAPVVAVGHTASDQAETVLLHLLRGSGLDGLTGMRARSPWPLGEGPVLARPLLCLWRRDTERYCALAGLQPRRDPTNESLEPLRNRLRHQALPLLRRLNPRLDDSLVRLAAIAGQAVAHLEAEAEGAWERLAQPGEEAVRLPRRGLLELSPALSARLLRRAYRHLAGPGAELAAVHTLGLQRLIARGRGGLHLPAGVRARATAESLELRLGPPPAAPPLPDTPLRVPGLTEVDGWAIEAEVVPPPPSPLTADPYEAYLDADALGGPLLLTSRRPGDRLRPLGLGGERKLQDIMVDAKVPREERDRLPLLRCPWGIAWAVGLRVDERAAVGPATRRVLHLRARRLPRESEA